MDGNVESWSSLSIKRTDDIDTLIIDFNEDPKVTASKTQLFLQTMRRVNIHPPFKLGGILSSDSENLELSSFIEEHNVMASGNKTLLQPESLKRLQMLGFHRAIIKTSKDKIAACIMTLDIGVRYITKDQKIEDSRIGCTTFLVVHPNLRGVGLAMAAIKEAIGIGVQFNVHTGYHMISEFKGINHIPVPSWQYNILEKFDVTFKRIEGDDIRSSRCMFLEFVKGMRFNFNPNEEEWERWMKCFESFIVMKNDVCVGIVILHVIDMIHQEIKGITKIGWPMIIVGDVQEGIRTCNNVCLQSKIEYILFHEIGCLTEEELLKSGSKRTNNTKYLDFYNVGVDAKAYEICLPLI